MMKKLSLEALKARQMARKIRRMPVALLLENIRSLYNVGSFFRTADCAGVCEIFLTGITAAPPRKEITKVALGAETVVPWRHIPNPIEAAQRIKSQGYRLIALEQTDQSQDLYTTPLPFPCCVTFGYEVEGISNALLAECEMALEAPMWGSKESLNVAVCGGVALFEIRRKFQTYSGKYCFEEIRNPGT